jgi:PST family polysaccharide transporter
MVVINVFLLLSAVAFPIFSRVRDDPERLRSGYLTSLRIESAYGAGAGVALAVSAPMLVHVLFGPRWAASVAPLEALGLYATFRALGFGAVDVYKAVGRPGLAAGVSLVRLLVLVPVLIVAAGFGIRGVAWAQAGLAFVFAVYMQAVACRVIGIRVTALWTAVRPAIAVAVGVGVGAGAVRLGLPGPEPLRLAAALAASVTGAVCALWAADRRLLAEMRALVPGGDLPKVASA